MSSVAVNGILGFIMLVTLCFTLGEVEQVLDSSTGFPFIQIFYNTTGSLAATNAMTAVLIVTLTASTITEVATASRQLWSFARDEGIPFSSFFAYVRIIPDENFPRAFPNKPALMIPAGYTGVEHPSELGDGVFGGDNAPFDDQHWFSGGPQRSDIIDNHVFDVCIYSIHRLCAPEAAPRRIPATPSLVAGPIRNGGQYWRFSIFATSLCFCFFPHVNHNYARDDELECCHVHWRHWIGNAVLLGQGTASFHPARGTSQERRWPLMTPAR